MCEEIKRGRPRLDEPRDAHVDARVTKRTRAACKVAARRAGLSLSAWAGFVLTEAARWHGSPSAKDAPQDGGTEK